MTSYIFIFDQKSPSWRDDETHNRILLRGIRTHARSLMEIRGYLFLNEVLDLLNLPRVQEGQVLGWTPDKLLDPDLFRIEGSNEAVQLQFFPHGEILSSLPTIKEL